MVSNKEQILKEIKENEDTIALYKESFPENPVFAVGKKRAAKKQ